MLHLQSHIFLKNDFKDPGFGRLEGMVKLKQAMAHGIRAHESGRFELARSVFEAIVREAPNHPVSASAWAKLAQLHTKQERRSEAAHCAFQSLMIDPGHPVANVISARCSAQSGDVRMALRQLNAVAPERWDSGLLFERARLLDCLGKHAESHAEFVRANQWRTNEYPGASRDRLLRLITDTRTRFTQDWVDGWYDVSPSERQVPLFLVGFSRSGLGLIDPIIAAHPGAEVLCGVMALNAARRVLGGRYPQGLSNLDEPSIDRARNAYFRVLDDHISPDFRGLVIDVLPFNSILLGLLYRLFPEARVVHTVRHPADVVLSNFMHPYESNDVTIHFDSIESTAHLYADVMGLTQHFQAILPMQFLELRYENLVYDFESERRRLLRYAGLMNPSGLPEASAYAAEAEKVTATASVGRWQHYADVLEPIWDHLTPYVRAYGYTD